VLFRESRGDTAPGPRRGILDLIEELLSNTAKLLEQRLMLLRLEVEDTLGTLMRRLATLVIGGALAGLGLVLTSIALALWIGGLLGSLVAGYALTGAAFLLTGAVIVAVRLGLGVRPRQPLAERTVKELQKDTRWLKIER
jgi:uncharacterized membrane protein YqjE